MGGIPQTITTKSKIMDKDIFTHEQWKTFKAHYKLNNKMVGDIIGTSEQNVKTQTQPSKPLASWAKAFIYAWVNAPATGF